MSPPRRVAEVLSRTPTLEGAGVHLHRVFGFREVPRLDPFLLLDDFGSEDPADYVAGFPWHPHRGIETVTYMLAGEVEHGDSLGHRGVIASGDVQWMTAGSGIVHQEMPRRFDGRFRGFQLWLNLPAARKMTDPRYRDVPAAAIPLATPAPGVRARVVAGEVDGVRGPVGDLVVECAYLDVALDAGTTWERPVPASHAAFAYAVEGRGRIGAEPARGLVEGQLGRLSGEGPVRLAAESDPFRVLLVSGVPLGEPVAWHGPIAMNTDAEIELALRELREGTFIKHPR